MKTVVIGSGSWGTALAQVLCDNGQDVIIYGNCREQIEDIEQNHRNSMFFEDVQLHPDLHATLEVEVVADADIIVLSVPTIAIESVCRQIDPLLKKSVIVVNTSKGFHPETNERISEVIRRFISPAHLHSVVSLIGPSHAEEVVIRLLTAICAVSLNDDDAKVIQELFSNDYLRVYTGNDEIGSETGVALKNAIAVASGVLSGLGYGDNTRALLMTRGLTETARLGVAMGGKKETFAGLAGVGDLIVTCTSMHSRNHRAGIMIGKGLSIEQTLKEVGGVVEGYYATDTVRTLARKYGIEMPISEGAYQVLYNGRAPKEVLRELMCRDKKHEIEDASW